MCEGVWWVCVLEGEVHRIYALLGDFVFFRGFCGCRRMSLQVLFRVFGGRCFLVADAVVAWVSLTQK